MMVIMFIIDKAIIEMNTTNMTKNTTATNDNVISTTNHKLHSIWSLFFVKMDKQKDWKDNMYKVYDIDSIETFWCIMHHMKPVSNLPYGSDYYLFRENIQPMWEHPLNKNGGIWVISSHKSRRHTHLNEMWMEVLMFLVGEVMDKDSDEICGVSINIRGNFDKISVWTRDCTNHEANKRIGLQLKSMLKLNQDIEYISHYNNQTKNHSNPKPTLVV